MTIVFNFKYQEKIILTFKTVKGIEAHIKEF